MSDTPLWIPRADRAAASQVQAFIAEVNRRHGHAPCRPTATCMPGRSPIPTCSGAWSGTSATSSATKASAWSPTTARCRARRSFPDAQLNFAENLLRRSDDGEAHRLPRRGQGRRRRLTWAELNALVSRAAAGAARPPASAIGDRVAAMLPNLPEAVALMLATTSLGAIWSSCSPDFGERGVLDRFGQIEPKVFVAVDGYWYNGKPIRLAGQAQADRRAPADGASGRHRRLSRRGRSGGEGTAARHRRFDAWLKPFAAKPRDLRAAAVRSPALHPVLLRHDRRAEMHRARRRRHAAAASQGAPAAMRPARRASGCSTSPRSAG